METKTETPVPENIATRLFDSRTVIISGEINQKLAASVVAQLVGMAAASDSDITLFINSQGGHVEAGDTIHDMIRFIRPRVRIIGTGWVRVQVHLSLLQCPSRTGIAYLTHASCFTSQLAVRAVLRVILKSKPVKF